MRDTSLIANFDTIYASGSYHIESKLRLNGIDYGEDKLISIHTTPALFVDTPSVGGCYSAEIDVVMLTPSVTIPKMAEMRPYVRLVGETLTSAWIPQGVFYIDTRTQTDDNNADSVLSLHGYDAMLKTEALYPVDDSVDYPQSDLYCVGTIASAIGAETDSRVYDIMRKYYPINLPATYTMREVLGYIASMYAGNWCMSPEGKLRLVALNGIGYETNYLIDEHGDKITFGGDRILV